MEGPGQLPAPEWLHAGSLGSSCPLVSPVSSRDEGPLPSTPGCGSAPSPLLTPRQGGLFELITLGSN